MALGMTVPLVVGLCSAIWWLVASSRRERRRRRAATDGNDRRDQAAPSSTRQRDRPAHLFRGQGEAVTVAELLEEARERGGSVRPDWPKERLDEAGWVRPYARGQLPTVVLARVTAPEAAIENGRNHRQR